MVTMKNAILKDTYREIKRTLSRFLSIFAIVAIGVGFFAGVKATAPDMKLTADKYYDDYNMMDIRLVSTMGLTEEDAASVKGLSGVEGIYKSYSMDALVTIKDKDLVVKVHGIPTDKLERPDESYINRVKLIEGRYPQKPNECLAAKGKFFSSGMSVGSTIRLSSGTDENIGEKLKENEFTVVGIIQTPYYVSFEMGTSSIGSGKVNGFIMIPQENFKLDVFTDIFITVKGAREKLSYNDSYKDTVEPVKNALEDMEESRTKIRYEEIVNDANKEIDEHKKELQEAEEKQKTELQSAEKKLNDARKQIADGERKLKLQEDSFNNTIRAAEEKLAEGRRKLESGEAEYSANYKSFAAGKKQAEIEIPLVEQQITKAQQDLDKSEADINGLKAYLAGNTNLPSEQRVKLEEQVKSGEQQISYGKAQLSASKAQLEAKKKELSSGETALAAARKQLDESRQQIESEEKKLTESRKTAELEFAKARRKIQDSRKDLQQGEIDYEKGKKEADEKIADARTKITDAEDKVRKIEKPVWYVLDRETNHGFVEYGMAADRIDAISKVFPVFFFLIAALVCLTTMTRMVDEQRTHIGTLKALGYSKLAIASKYLLYAALASVAGSIAGLLVGFRIFPTVISNAYGIIYTLPPIITEFNIFYAAASTAVAVLATTMAAFYACYKDLVIEPAALMRPKAPRAGKRIILERITFLWSRFNFIQKITARNIFRYKQRFFMTVLGVAGCTALLLSGFGLKDSIVDITEKQFDDLYQYDMTVDFKKDASREEVLKVADEFTKDRRISSFILAKDQAVDAGKNNVEKSVSLIVPDSSDKLQSFIKLRVRTTGIRVPLSDEGVVITEKLGKLLGADIGDEIYIKNGDKKTITVKVAGITENYVSHFIYMSPETYETLYNEKPEFQRIITKTAESSDSFENSLSAELLKNEKIGSVSFITGISSNFKDIIGSLNYVILVLIASAGALAFVVLYNLTNVNIAERLREIATIKVLGFYDNEVSSYVYRENFILTIIGTAAGLGLGFYLHKFIVVTAEIEYTMFGRDIKPLSYLYASVLTILFSAMVNLVMYFKLKKISMVESLKSVD